MAEENNEQTLLEKSNQMERDIILKARDDPKNAVLADGTPFLEVQEQNLKNHNEEGSQALKTQLARVREQSVGTDPLYQGKLEPQKGSPGTFTIIPDSEEKQRGRIRGERLKRSMLANEEEPKEEPSNQATTGQPDIATQPPEETRTDQSVPTEII